MNLVVCPHLSTNDTDHYLALVVCATLIVAVDATLIVAVDAAGNGN